MPELKVEVTTIDGALTRWSASTVYTDGDDGSKTTAIRDLNTALGKEITHNNVRLRSRHVPDGGMSVFVPVGGWNWWIWWPLQQFAGWFLPNLLKVAFAACALIITGMVVSNLYTWTWDTGKLVQKNDALLAEISNNLKELKAKVATKQSIKTEFLQFRVSHFAPMDKRVTLLEKDINANNTVTTEWNCVTRQCQIQHDEHLQCPNTP
eukprot:TRINITY_DN68183_c4_g2_i1.p1 TRINITY_DN68183_c4_g2~~TRINITY_DN68183_c4_g2_i1.p1  ORF type:complete len:208 (+),score=23.19 TRINITY_DN68183_c4_g2_i1:85-708(+)